MSSRGIRELKDQVSREILDTFDAAKIQVASATYEIVGLPPLRIEGPALNSTPHGAP